MNDFTIYDRLPQRDVEIAGFNVHLVDAGAGFPIVLVHGSPASSILFRHQIARLSHSFRVIAPDLLGFGQSAVPAGGTAFREQAKVLRALLDHVGVERHALLGHDWGGPIAMASAIQRPEQVSRLVLVNTSLRPDFSPPWYWKPFVAPVLGEFLLVQLNLFGRGLPLMMRAAREKSLRRRYLAPLSRPDTRRTVLLLERLTGYGALMREVVDVLPRMVGRAQRPAEASPVGGQSAPTARWTSLLSCRPSHVEHQFARDFPIPHLEDVHQPHFDLRPDGKMPIAVADHLERHEAVVDDAILSREALQEGEPDVTH
jgi:pimeloyl-ACP methyl ester carboxylesterase